jgi:uncharacterized protein YecA (UPF0149 family)
MDTDKLRPLDSSELWAARKIQKEEDDRRRRPGMGTVRRRFKVKANAKCPCGSGKKFKHCHRGDEVALRLLLGV